MKPGRKDDFKHTLKIYDASMPVQCFVKSNLRIQFYESIDNHI